MILDSWNRERRLLRHVMEAGGYFTRDQVKGLSRIVGLSSSAPSVRDRLERWMEGDWIQRFDSKLAGSIPVYRLACRALRLLSDKDSHIRRHDSLQLVIEKLRTVDFLIAFMARGFDQPLSPLSLGRDWLS